MATICARSRGCSTAPSIGSAAATSAASARSTIEAEQPMAFHVDGEPVVGGTRLTVRVHPSALQDRSQMNEEFGIENSEFATNS